MANLKTDKYANKLYGTVTETGANTLTYSEIKTNVSIFDKVAWIIHRLEWYLAATELDKLLGLGDSITMALTASDKAAALALNDASVIDLMTINHKDLTAVGFSDYPTPFIRDFSGLPGGGLIVSPRPLYLAAKGVSLASAVTAQCRGFFTVLELSADEYLELVDFYRIVQ